MAEAKGPVKHILIAKFKEEVSSEKIEELINGYANLVKLIEPMKDFHWGQDVSIENLHQGYTHIFESTFDSKEDVAEYIAHPVHVEFATMFLGSLEKVLVIDYKPTYSSSEYEGKNRNKPLAFAQIMFEMTRAMPTYTLKIVAVLQN